MTGIKRGIIAKWFDEKGYGFITPTTGEADLFFHISSVRNSLRRDLLGQRVTFVEGSGNNGKPAATDVYLAIENIKPVRKASTRKTQSPRSSVFAWGFAGIFFLALADLALIKAIPLPIIAAYAVMSGLTYWVYVGDKLKAELNAWRTPEATLHWLELLGGWPGALAAQWQIGHKNRKLRYQLVFWFIVLLHLGVLGVVFKDTIIHQQEVSQSIAPHNPNILISLR